MKRFTKIAALALVLMLTLLLPACEILGEELISVINEELTATTTTVAAEETTAAPETAPAETETEPEETETEPEETETEPEETETEAETTAAEETEPETTEPETTAPAEPEETLPEDGEYDTRDEVALYIHLYGHLPGNYISKKEAEKKGWSGGGLDPYAYGKCIGGSNFGNYEGLLPEAKGRKYTECDIDTMHAKKRGAKRIVFSNDGLIYYTDDHYESFTLLYTAEGAAK